MAKKKARKPKQELPPLSDAQLEVMQRVWTRKEATVTDVWHDLIEQREVARNTVLTVMDRLAKRGWLEKRQVGNTHLYQATVSQDQTEGNLVSRFVDTVFSGAADRLIMALLDGRGVTDDEAARIKKLIAEQRKQRKK